MSFHLHEVMSNTKRSGWKKAVPHQGGPRGPTRVGFFFFLSGVYFRILQLVLLPCSSKLVIKTVSSLFHISGFLLKATKTSHLFLPFHTNQ